MLSPEIHRTNDTVTGILNEMVQLDGYAHGARNTTIGKLAEDPEWLAAVRHRVSMLSDAGAGWVRDRPDVFAAVLVQFTNYGTAFQSVADMQRKGTLAGRDDWIDVLKNVLAGPLEAAVTATQKADQALQDHHQAFAKVQPLLEDSIESGWTALADEEAQMTRIAASLATLQQRVNTLQDQITSETISSGKSYISSAVSISYEIVSTAGASIPFLSVASAAITVGMMFYDIISNTEQIDEDLEQIAALQLEASELAQAAAGTKAVLQILYDMEKSFASIQDLVPALTQMWRSELAKVHAAVEALESGVDPKSYLEIVSIPAAEANWQSICGFVQHVIDLQPSYGRPVILQPGHKPQAGPAPSELR